MDRKEIASKLKKIVPLPLAVILDNSQPLTDLFMEIANSDTITQEQAKKLFVLLAGTPPSEIIKTLEEFINMDTAALITLAKAAPNMKVKCVIYLLATWKVVKWVFGLLKARKEAQKE